MSPGEFFNVGADISNVNNFFRLEGHDAPCPSDHRSTSSFEPTAEGGLSGDDGMAVSLRIS